MDSLGGAMLISAVCLWARTKIRLRYRRRLNAKKKPKQIGFWTNGLIKTAVFATGGDPTTERKYNAVLAAVGPWGLRDFIETLPGRSKRHNSSHARSLKYCLQQYYSCPLDRYGAYRYFVAKIRNIAERSAIHDLTDDLDQWVQICMFPYKASLRGDKYTPLPDLARSNFYKLDITYRVPSDFLDTEAFRKKQKAIEDIWRCPVMIEQPTGLPGAVRIYPVGRLNHAQPVTNDHLAIGRGPEGFLFGRSIEGTVGAPIEFTLDKMVRRTHVLGLGGSGSGKSNAVGNVLSTAGAMATARALVETAYFIDITGGAGMEMYSRQGVTFATNIINIRQAISEIIEIHEFRVKELVKLGVSNWPIDDTHKFIVIVADELSQLLIDGGKVRGNTMAEIFTTWSKQLRKFGMFLMLFTQKATEKEGVPSGLTGNCAIRMCFPVRLRQTATDFFNCDMDSFKRAPTHLDQGQFVMEVPWQREFLYGKSDLAPHEVAQRTRHQ